MGNSRAARPLVSVIIPYYNEAEHLSACLRSVLAQRGPSIEVLAVDDGSTDGSDLIAAALARRAGGRLRLFSQDHQGPGAARNLAARAARGRVLAFVDADMTAAPGYLRRIIAPIFMDGEDGTCAADEMVANPLNRWSRAWSLAHRLPPERRLPLDLPERSDVYRAIRRDRFLSVGGNRAERGVGEDKMEGPGLRRALCVRGALLYHANPASAGEVCLSARWYGRGRAGWAGSATYVRLLWTHNPLRSVTAALWAGWRDRSVFSVFFKLWFDMAVLVGLWQGKWLKLKAR